MDEYLFKSMTISPDARRRAIDVTNTRYGFMVDGKLEEYTSRELPVKVVSEEVRRIAQITDERLREKEVFELVSVLIKGLQLTSVVADDFLDLADRAEEFMKRLKGS